MPTWVTVEGVPKSRVCIFYEGPDVLCIVLIIEDSGQPLSNTIEQNTISCQTDRDESPIHSIQEGEAIVLSVSLTRRASLLGRLPATSVTTFASILSEGALDRRSRQAFCF